MSVVSRSGLSLPDTIIAPRYDLNDVSAAIVHIGLGGFFRAHCARYTHDLMNADPSSTRWGIVGSGLRKTDATLLSALDRQDGLYTLVERDERSETRSLIGSLIRTIDASTRSVLLLEAIARPETRIVTITVSENGYHLDGVTKQLNHADPAIEHDLLWAGTPRTLLGILVEGYRRRRDAGQHAFTTLSCDNIQHNGQVVRSAVLSLAGLIDADLAAWIDEHARFPSSMVDRITPVPTPGQIAELQARTGFADQAPIFAETFRQWVIEDDFACGRPDWDRVGATFVSDVAPYEAMKLRLLNASHLAIAGLGMLCGHETVVEAIDDPFIRRYMTRLMDAETGPTLPPVPGIDLKIYKETLIDRFANPAIHDTLKRINADAPINLLLDPLRDRLAVNARIDLLALALAAWCRRVQIEATQSAHDRPMGAAEAMLQDRARTESDAASFLFVEPIFGSTGRDARLASNVRFWLQSFAEHGVQEALKRAAAAEFF